MSVLQEHLKSKNRKSYRFSNYDFNMKHFISPDNGRDKNRTSGRLSNGIPQVPQRRGPSELECFRRTLPVYERQEEIVATIEENQVALIVGETGSGKTTQVRCTCTAV